MIISISRRCDIPRFRFDWFLERLKAGFADVPNPFNVKQIRRVSLLPEDAEALVFWTRDPRHLLSHARELEDAGFFWYVMVTLNGYPECIEPNATPLREIVAAMAELASRIGERRVIWRYDPVFVSSLTDYSFHKRNFAALAAALKGALRRVIVSVYDEYPRTKRRIAALEARNGGFRLFSHYDGEGRLQSGIRDLLGSLGETAAGAGMEIQSCAEGENLEALGIRAGACIDGDLISGLRLGEALVPQKDRNQRPHCLCTAAIDIGTYTSCPAACVYCYAQAASGGGV
ncbi:MAG: DUF1848 domain-containing protein [Treponema sp.]|nr:DUF1848 domain-containing protein [Treponema sp.]